MSLEFFFGGSPLSVYIHIPFCTEKCGYCDFFSLSGRHPDQKRRTISNILDQLLWFFKHHPDSRIATLYIGGGTPSSIGVEVSEELFSGIHNLGAGWNDSLAEWTVEVNPETLTPELLTLYRDAGVTRLSVGMQTFSRRLLTSIGRTGSPDANLQALDIISGEWEGDVSLDLITCMPDQLMSEGVEDIDTITAWDPGHFSLYTLTVEPGTPLAGHIAAGRIRDPGESQDALVEIWHMQREMLKEAGYEQYEISNYAKPGKQSLHNLSYWRMLPYLGCGPGAVSTLPTTRGPARIENSRYLGSFSFDSKDTAMELISPMSFFIEHVMMGLRLSEGLSLKRLEGVFDVDPLAQMRNTYDAWRRRDLIEKVGQYIRLSELGRMYLDTFLREMVTELNYTNFSVIHWP